MPTVPTQSLGTNLNVVDDDGADVGAALGLVVGDLVVVNLREGGTDLLVLSVVGEEAVQLKLSIMIK